MAMNSFGKTFAPTQDAAEEARARGPFQSQQSPVKVLNLSLPRVVGSRAPAPESLLRPQVGGGGGGPDQAVIASILKAIVGGDAGLSNLPPLASSTLPGVSTTGPKPVVTQNVSQGVPPGPSPTPGPTTGGPTSPGPVQVDTPLPKLPSFLYPDNYQGDWTMLAGEGDAGGMKTVDLVKNLMDLIPMLSGQKPPSPHFQFTDNTGPGGGPFGPTPGGLV